MYHSLRDVANQTGMNKVTCFQHFKRLKHNHKGLVENNTKRYKNKILLNDKTYYALLNTFNHLHTNDKINVNSNTNLVIVKLLKSELNDKNKSINRLINQNDNLNKMLNHQQELQLGEQRRNKSLNKSLMKSLEFNKNHKKHKLLIWFKNLFK